MKQFEKIRLKKPKMSTFDLSHERKLTCNMGDLIPIFVSEYLPGDVFKVDMQMLVRLQPLIAPVMHRFNVYVHFFEVPNRLLLDTFEQFITGGKTGQEAPNWPKFTGSCDSYNIKNKVGSLGDYLGLPLCSTDDPTDATPVSQHLHRAYQLIWNQYYRDQNLQAEYNIPKHNSNLNWDDAEAQPLLKLRQRCWEKDYFTSALPWSQRGNQLTFPIGGTAPVSGSFEALLQQNVYNVPNKGLVSDQFSHLAAHDPSGPTDRTLTVTPGGDGLGNTLEADLSQATATTVNEFRRIFSVQRFLERSARGGYRYVEQLLHIFGVKSSDARLQRPVFLGGGKMPIRIGEVLQTSETNETPQANMAGHAVTGGEFMGFRRKFEEHGVVMGILSIMPRTSYQQGLPKIFSKFDRFDFYTPDFAHIGEQPVLRKEVFLSSDDAVNEEVFGYQPRYQEYRFMNDTVHGQMKTTMKNWHYGRIFTSNPLLNEGFVKPSFDNRIFAVTDVQNYGTVIVQSYANFKAIRPVSRYGEPI